MKKWISFYGLCFLILLLLGVTIYAIQNGNKCANKLLQRYSLSEKIEYEYAIKWPFSKGITLYHVRPANNNIIQGISSVKLYIARNNRFEFQVKKMRIDLFNWMRMKSDDEILNAFVSYIPYQDLLTKPLITLSLSGHKIIQVNIKGSFLFYPITKSGQLNASINIKDVITADIEWPMIGLPKSFAELTNAVLNIQKQSDLLQYSGTTLSIITTDNGFYQSYLDYLNTLPPDLVLQHKTRYENRSSWLKTPRNHFKTNPMWLF